MNTTSSSQGSLLDDVDSLHDVFIWGEGTGDGLLGGGGGGVHRIENSTSAKVDALSPKALRSSMAFDARKVSCGSRHAVVITKQRAVYSWGEGSGGKLGHGVESDVSIPKLINDLRRSNVEQIACGENHTCAVTQAGHLYTWGDGTHNSGLLGHGTQASSWIPRKVEGQIEGMRISFISCGPWHSAAATSEGQLFTFGDGTFGALGHGIGDRSATYRPRAVEALKGLRTVKVSCGVWHTAAIVEVGYEPSTSGSLPAWKLFTWGNGDKGQLGHDDKDPRFSPSCVLTLYDKNFCQVACGHSMTVALTTSGQVYTMGSADYGQLGDPENTGNPPSCIEGKLKDICVQEISCGSHHVAILNSKHEVYTWGKGEKGQLGHGDNKDRNIPTLLEALHEAKSVVCGSNFTVAICLRKHSCAVDSPMCSSCQTQFNSKKKRQNCYNCGLVFCKQCSNRKSLKASLAPNKDKPCRVCEDCYYRLNKEETDMRPSYLPPKVSRTNTNRRLVPDNDQKSAYHKSQSLLARLSSLDSFRLSGTQHPKPENSQESNNSGTISSQNQSLQKEYSYASNSSPFVFDPGRIASFLPSSLTGFQAASTTISAKPSPNHSTSFSCTTVLALSEAKGDDSKSKNDDPNKEISTLRDQVEYLSKKVQIIESELKTTSLQLKEATKQARDEEEKNKVAKVEIKSLTTQLEELVRLVGHGSSPLCRVSGSYAGRTTRTFGRASLRRQWTL